MSNFSFYHGDDQAVVESLRRATASSWGAVKEVSLDSFWLFIPVDDFARGFYESPDALGTVSGYVRCDDLEDASEGSGHSHERHGQRFISEIASDSHWPLDGRWTGSFGAIVYSKLRREIILCNDLIGYHPVYFSTSGKGILGGTSLIVLSHCVECEVDVVGVAQRITSPYCNYGRRTILKQVSRLLPGEWLKFAAEGQKFDSVFDNSLCDGLMRGDVNTIARTVWDCLERETVLGAGVTDRVCVAMSGGWDSRLVLGGVAHRVDTVDCYTYGGEDHYEVGLARRCASAVGASHRSFPIENKYFPSRESLEGLVRETESANFMEWYGIIEACKSGGEKSTLLLGDLCESIDGRYMGEFSSRQARKKSFVNGLLGKSDQIAVATTAAFNQWKEEKEKRIIESIIGSIDKLSPALASRCTEDLIARSVASDLEISFQRVRENMPPFTPMYDELFLWFHRVRFLLANQIPFLASAFRPVCPGVSMRFLRLITTVHPRLRMRRRLMNAIARLPEFDALARVPSAQIPWLSARAPSLMRDVLWGVRSGLDQVLIKSVMKSKNGQKRQRVLPSLDYIKEYQRDYVVPNVRDWFSGRWIRGDQYIQTVKGRADLSAWPLIGVDISAPANVSITLDLCRVNNVS